MKRTTRSRSSERQSFDLDHEPKAGAFAAMPRQTATKESKDEVSSMDDSSIRELEKEDPDR
jgi:hypothetical protein